MGSAYAVLDGESMLREQHRRTRALERGSVKNRVREFAEPPDVEVEGAMFYLFEGQLRVRIGTTDYSVNLTPL